MNRRQFTQRLAAVAAAPLVPTGLASSAVAGTAQVSQKHQWAAFIARIHNKASPAMLKRHLSLSDGEATQVFNALVKDQIISRPNQMGISHAMNPFKRDFGTGLAPTPQAAFKPKVQEAAQKLDQAMDDLDQFVDSDSVTVNQDTPKCEDDTFQDSADGPAKITP